LKYKLQNKKNELLAVKVLDLLRLEKVHDERVEVRLVLGAVQVAHTQAQVDLADFLVVHVLLAAHQAGD
jgi:hypothetical protein